MLETFFALAAVPGGALLDMPKVSMLQTFLFELISPPVTAG